MKVRFEQVESKEKEGALIRAAEKTTDILNAIDLLENGSGGIRMGTIGSMSEPTLPALFK